MRSLFNVKTKFDTRLIVALDPDEAMQIRKAAVIKVTEVKPENMPQYSSDAFNEIKNCPISGQAACGWEGRNYRWSVFKNENDTWTAPWHTTVK